MSRTRLNAEELKQQQQNIKHRRIKDFLNLLKLKMSVRHVTKVLAAIGFPLLRICCVFGEEVMGRLEPLTRPADAAAHADGSEPSAARTSGRPPRAAPRRPITAALARGGVA